MEIEGIPHGVGTNTGLSTAMPPVYEKISMGVSYIIYRHFHMFSIMHFRQQFLHASTTEVSCLPLMVEHPM